LVRIELSSSIAAPIERCFNLSRSIDLNLASTEGRQEAVAGVTSGLIGLGQEVTWSRRHFGFVIRHTSRITAYELPRYFQDSMARGLFQSYCHDHYFEECDGATLMKDVVRFAVPYGVLGRVVERPMLAQYMRKLIERRSSYLKSTAESEQYRKYLRG
jgi:ligand-binding SRPBCC domain-containing protein